MWQVIGQERAVSFLKAALGKGSLAHAYLFVGPAHVGKMTLALNLAQALNCEAADAPCGHCTSCLRVASGSHADIQVLGLRDAAPGNGVSPTEIGIDHIRQLQHSASLPPFEGKYKVFIIGDAEFLSTEAANCLLKTLEEPASKVVFILLTAHEQRLLATIISRCQRLELLPLPAAEIAKALNEKWGVEPARAALLARLSHGCPGWAVSAVSDEILIQQRDERLDELLTVIGADLETRFECAARWSGQSNQNRQTVWDRLELWLDWWRDLLLVKSSSEAMVTNIDRLDLLAGLAKNYSLTQISDVIKSIQSARGQIRQNANLQLVLEVLMLNLPETVKPALRKR
ncbi:MAG: DNA polymerase III subunit delta' [Chloroflexi bacterium]|nr:DNA polymerase III subunit delta' [Chloroflexota bacterium]